MVHPKRLVDISGTCETREARYTDLSCVPNEPFVALSHVWSKFNPVELHNHRGVSWGVPAFRQSNLIELLRLLWQCYNEECNAVWVDAYCINQDDDSEKGEEIVRMGEYYSTAFKVVILPNGVDGMCSNSVAFDDNSGHWCKWTQRVWTAPEVSLARDPVVVCCLTKPQALRVEEIRERDINRQLFPVNIIHTRSVGDNNKLLIIDLEGYCELVTMKASGYIDGKRDNNDGDFDYPAGVERTMRTLTNIKEENNITHWVHRTAIRDCQKDADRIYSMLPKLALNIVFVNEEDDLEKAMAKILCKITDNRVMAHLVLSTMTYNRCIYTRTCVFPSLKLSKNEIATLVYIDQIIEPYDTLGMMFIASKGLLIENARIVLDVLMDQYVYNAREGFTDADNVFGNTAYRLGDTDLPCSVGKCSVVGIVNLVGIGSIRLTSGNRFRMIELYGDKDTEDMILICCMVCDKSMHKVGVLMVDGDTFSTLNQGETAKLLTIG